MTARTHQLVLAAAALVGLTATTATAQTYPDRPITLIVPFSAGGGTDLGARLLADDLEEVLGTTIVVENREGAGSQVGLTALAQAAPDGYTIGAVNQPALDTIILSPERQPAFDIDSFDYIINHVAEPIIIAVMPDSPYETLEDLVEDARARPGELRVGTSGLLTPEHLAQLQFQEAADTRLRIAHFNGAADSMTQFRGGRTDIAFTTPSFLAELKPLAILTPERSSALPDVPTAAEQGYPDMVMVSSRGFAVPAGVPEDILQTLREAFETVAESPEHQARAAEAKLSLYVIGGDEYGDFARANHEAARELVELSRQSN